MGLGGTALGTLGTAAALLSGTALKQRSPRGAREHLESTGETLMTHPDTTTAAHVTRTTVESATR